MTKQILLIAFSFFCITFLFSSCDDEAIHPLIGTWDYEYRTMSDCANSDDNETIDYTGDGYCEEFGGTTRCSKISLVMTGEEYTISQVTTENETETTLILETGTYKLSDVAGANIQFCTDILCRPENYSISNGRLILKSSDANTDCMVDITATKR